MKQFNTNIGDVVWYQGKQFIITRLLDLDAVLGEEAGTKRPLRLPVAELHPVDQTKVPLDEQTAKEDDLALLSDTDLQRAQQRYAIIQPLLADRGNWQLVIQTSKQHNVHVTTLYRWLTIYDETGSVTALAGRKRTGGEGKPRLAPETEQIITTAIQDVYLTSQRKPVSRTVQEIKQRCLVAGVKPPSSETVRQRITRLSPELVMRKRYSRKRANDTFRPLNGHFPGADFPLAVVQIDHTLVDLMLVDEVHRKPVNRPWITVAIDVYSRMVVGFYVSFDTPGAIGTGMCIANAILPKEMLLSRLNVEGTWPCYGVMRTIHVDNAKEFRGTMLAKACARYNIELSHRPVKTPEWGGTVERLIGTFMREIHTLPGTTFSNPQHRQDYQSEKQAALTLSEFERWLTIFIVKIYHLRVHSSLEKPPLDRYKEGILGTADTPARGLPSRFHDERQLRLDFMPFVMRSIQEYGVVIDHIYYYNDILRSYIHARESTSSRNRTKKEFLFRRDPRDISVIYFYDEDTQTYHDIPYRNRTGAPMSVWEYREVKKQIKIQGGKVDETAIFKARMEMQTIEEQAVVDTKQISRQGYKKLAKVSARTSSKKKARTTFQAIPPSQPAEPGPPASPSTPGVDYKETIELQILPYDDLDDGAFTRQYEAVAWVAGQ